MVDLNDPQQISQYDPKDVFGSTEKFLDQCLQISDVVDQLKLPENFQHINNIIFCGMGGSALGAQVVYYLYKNYLKKPFYINNDYNLPGFANQDTLVILSSYSGSTEETLSCFEQAKNKGCNIIGITTGGKLAHVLEENNLPLVKFDPTYNPSGQPRLGIGYAVLGTIKILSKINLLEFDQNTLNLANNYLRENQHQVKQSAQDTAQQLYGFIPLIITAGELTGCAHVLRNQLNETAKSLSLYATLPELNHHLMEGLKNPADKKIKVLTFDSILYPPSILKRMDLTKDVIKQNQIEVISYKVKSTDLFTQALETLMFSGYLTFYLAILYEQDPSLIPWVDYFKAKLTN